MTATVDLSHAHDEAHYHASSPARPGFWALTLGSVGVVYGDIGTSPLYALREALLHSQEGSITREEVLGVTSLLLWALIFAVTVKYVLFPVLRRRLKPAGLCRPKLPAGAAAVSLLANEQLKEVLRRKLFPALSWCWKTAPSFRRLTAPVVRRPVDIQVS